MSVDGKVHVSGPRLRQGVSALQAERARSIPHELSSAAAPSVVYEFAEDGTLHGNFLQPSLRRILADRRWARRLEKAYTGAARMPRAGDRRRGELECATSSDALLMNVFCYPGVLRRAGLCACLGVSPGLRPSFGVRVSLPMHREEIDRTELDMRLGDLLVEAKLTESGFGKASLDRLLRYRELEQVFEISELPQPAGSFVGYQLIRGILAAQRHGIRYAVLLDERRTDLQEVCFRVLCAVRGSEARGRFRLITWQDLVPGLPETLQQFLAERFGIQQA